MDKTRRKTGLSRENSAPGCRKAKNDRLFCAIITAFHSFLWQRPFAYDILFRKPISRFCTHGVLHIDKEHIMKTIYILLTRSGTLLSNLVYTFTGAEYTHASLAFDEDLSCLYSSTRKNGYTMFPAGPSKEYLNRGVFRLRENVPCALYALEVTDDAYIRARRRAEHMMAHGNLYRFNVIGLALCGFHIRWQRRRHYFCSQLVGEVLEKSGSMELPKHTTLMRPNDFSSMEQLQCVFRGKLADLPQRQEMEFDQDETVVGVYLGLALGLFRAGVSGVKSIF